MKRTLMMAVVALVIGTAAVMIGQSAATAGAPVRWVVINSDQRSPLLVGLPLHRATAYANSHHIKLHVIRVFEDAAKDRVTQEPRGLPGTLWLVASKGPPKSLWAVLRGAKGPPISEECAPRFVVDEDGNGDPATCDGTRVNVATWNYFAPYRPPMYSLGRNATRCQVAAVYDEGHLDAAWNFSVYEMAKAYYGWHFGPAFTDQLVNAGSYADNCKSLTPSSAP